ncbi:Nuclear cap-binding protein subunit [Trichostrongylus colubriformis]|uniref:Nuclear cap-binding protein subunit 1 n=2 Tax=Trichostrongylus colubriformis TaxID=6319 RepID=A0AAN8F122_TRICO
MCAVGMRRALQNVAACGTLKGVLDSGPPPSLLIFDDVSTLERLNMREFKVVCLLYKLYSRLEPDGLLLALFALKTKAFSMMLSKADFVIEITPVGSGFGKDVSGQVRCLVCLSCCECSRIYTYAQHFRVAVRHWGTLDEVFLSWWKLILEYINERFYRNVLNKSLMLLAHFYFIDLGTFALEGIIYQNEQPQEAYERWSVFDYDGDIKRRRNVPEYDEVERRLQNLIIRVDESTGSSSLESNLESLCSLLESDLDKYRTKIIEIVTLCVCQLPDKITVYSTLVGLLNAKNFNFGGEIVEKLISDLQEKLEAEDFQQAMFIITFLCDLGNSRVLTLSSIVEFLEALLQCVFEENVPQARTDWFAYVVLRVLPWIGLELSEKKKDELENILEGASKYVEGRRKVHLKMLQVWSSSSPHEQEDYLDCLLAQIKSLQGVGWKEKQIARHYVAFDAALQDALQHNLPSFTPPIHREDSSYPLPMVVFRLFDYADCPEDGTVLPGAHSIERFLIEEELNWIIEFNASDRKICAQELTNYARGANVPIAYMILEVLFSQLFRLPLPPQPTGFYGPVLLDLCRVQSSTMPQVLAQAAELLYQRVATMQPLCLDRFVDWFSFHLSNFGFRWSWNDWKDCLTADRWDAKKIFAREVIERCRRLSYYGQLKEFLPTSFAAMIPPPPDVVCKFDDENQPGYEAASKFLTLIQSRSDDNTIMAEIRDGENRYDPDLFGIFFAVLLKTSAKSFSHTFVALSRYSTTLKTIADTSDEMQEVLLFCLFQCWRHNHLRIIILVDKMLKMQILDCGVVISWIFSESLRSETDRQWVWEVLNTALERLSRHIHKVAHDVEILQKRVDRQRNEAGDEMEDSEVKTREQEELEQQQEKLDNLKDFQKSLFLDVLHKFTVLLTEFIVHCETEGTDFRTPYFAWINGRFKQIFLMHGADLHEFTDDLRRELFSSSDIDPNVLETFQQFVALRE